MRYTLDKRKGTYLIGLDGKFSMLVSGFNGSTSRSVGTDRIVVFHNFEIRTSCYSSSARRACGAWVTDGSVIR